MARISKAHVSGRALRIRVDEGPDGKAHSPKKAVLSRKDSRDLAKSRTDRGRGHRLGHGDDHRRDDRRGGRDFGEKSSFRGGRATLPQRKSASKKLGKGRRFGR